MYESDIKIFELIQLLKSLGKIEFESDFCKDIGLLKQNLQRIKNGIAHFTPKHIQSICEKYNINSNWIFGLETNVYRLKTIPFHR